MLSVHLSLVDEGYGGLSPIVILPSRSMRGLGMEVGMKQKVGAVQGGGYDRRVNRDRGDDDFLLEVLILQVMVELLYPSCVRVRVVICCMGIGIGTAMS